MDGMIPVMLAKYQVVPIMYQSRAPRRHRRWSHHPHPTLELVAGDASFIVRATSELIAGGRVLRHPHPTPELVADGRILHHPHHVGAHLLDPGKKQPSLSSPTTQPAVESSAVHAHAGARRRRPRPLLTEQVLFLGLRWRFLLVATSSTLLSSRSSLDRQGDKGIPFW
uniref:Uncharacterized protein n=1 Tax=Oryza punctata TaxID=4537 RepID=A0A0E0L756_ORYPU